MPPPDEPSRAKLFEMNLEKAPIGSDMDFKKLASLTAGYTGADIANACRQAKMNALESSLTNAAETPISLEEMIAIIQKSKPSAPTQSLGGTRTS